MERSSIWTLKRCGFLWVFFSRIMYLKSILIYEFPHLYHTQRKTYTYFFFCKLKLIHTFMWRFMWDRQLPDWANLKASFVASNLIFFNHVHFYYIKEPKVPLCHLNIIFIPKVYNSFWFNKEEVHVDSHHHYRFP